MTAPDSKRAEYLCGDLTHDAYYGLLIDLIGERALVQALPGDRTAREWAALVEQDRHLNNVPLRQWDRLHGYVFGLLHGKRDELASINGSGSWSLSDSVCVLKCAARRYAQVTA